MSGTAGSSGSNFKDPCLQDVLVFLMAICIGTNDDVTTRKEGCIVGSIFESVLKCSAHLKDVLVLCMSLLVKRQQLKSFTIQAKHLPNKQKYGLVKMFTPNNNFTLLYFLSTRQASIENGRS